MTSRRVLIHSELRDLTADDFLWRIGEAGESSFHVSIDPELTQFGEVPRPNRDAATLGVGVFLSDRTVPRPRSWERGIDLELPVYAVSNWRSSAGRVESLLNLLTSDAWSLSFGKRGPDAEAEPFDRPDIDLVSLLSGGADSLCGAMRALSEQRRVLFVSHWDWSVDSGYQRRLIARLTERFPDQVFHQQVQIGRAQNQLNGSRFGEEPSRRSRALLFVTLGLAAAAVSPSVPLWVPENGFASINPPLAGERRGSLSTRSTHPQFLSELREVLEALGAHADFVNPFFTLTKGEMFREAASHIGDEAASELLSQSRSCAHARWATGTGLPPDTQCGVCFGCLIRRAAFAAAGLDDATLYLHTTLSANKRPPHLQRAAREEVRTIQYAIERGVRQTDILAGGFPADDSLDAATALVERAFDELGALLTSSADLTEV